MPQTAVSERAARVRFRRALTLMAFTLVVPGSAQLLAGNRTVGRWAVRVWLATWAVAAVIGVRVLLDHAYALDLALSPGFMLAVRISLVLGAVAWAALFVDAWRIGQPLSLGLQHRRVVVGVNGILCFSVAGTMLIGAHLAGAQHAWLTTFADGDLGTSHQGRYNILLLGGDSGATRWGLRTDSMTVASVDATTGRTVMIGLPRNMQRFPFREGSLMAEQFPDGFDCDGCYLNSLTTWAADHKELFGDSQHPGVDATVDAIEGITGLTINYWAMVNLRGFKRLIDAFGGVTLTVRQRIPVGGLGKDVTGYIEPGTRKLDGHDALWFARAREGSDDYSRMARQKCVMTALLAQVNPAQAITNFQEIARASSEMITTDIPGGALSDLAQLALRARTQKVSTVSLVPPRVNTARPDIAKVHRMVAKAIARAEGKAPAAGKATASASASASAPAPGGDAGAADAATPSTVTGGSLGSRNSGYVANETDDLASAC